MTLKKNSNVKLRTGMPVGILWVGQKVPLIDKMHQKDIYYPNVTNITTFKLGQE
jgi:hypothetical protein